MLFVTKLETCYIQSTKFESGVPNFLLQVFETLNYKAYHMGINCVIGTLSNNLITVLDRWSRLEATVWYLSCVESSHYKKVLSDHQESMGVKRIGK